MKYLCLIPGCKNLASMYATDNRAEHGHICWKCWQTQPDFEQALYATATEKVITGESYREV